MKKTYAFLLAITISLAAFSESASAATTWVYKVQPSGAIRGGKLKLVFSGGSKSARNLRFKWKIDTIIGERRDWIPLQMPAQAFDRTALASIAPGTSARLGSVDVSCERQGTYRTQISGIPFRFTTGSGSVWPTIELKVGGQTIRGNFLAVTDE